MRRVDLVDRPLAEELLQVIDVGAASLLNGSPGRDGNDHVALDPLAQLLLSLRAREPVRVTLVRLSPSLRFTRAPRSPTTPTLEASRCS